MKWNFTLSSEAEADIDDIYDYTERTHGIDQAKKYISGLFAEIEKRVENPYHATRSEVGLARRLELEEVRSFLYERYHRCYFTFDNKGLFVLTVYHGARDREKGIEKMMRAKVENG